MRCPSNNERNAISNGKNTRNCSVSSFHCRDKGQRSQREGGRVKLFHPLRSCQPCCRLGSRTWLRQKPQRSKMGGGTWPQGMSAPPWSLTLCLTLVILAQKFQNICLMMVPIRPGKRRCHELHIHSKAALPKTSGHPCPSRAKISLSSTHLRKELLPKRLRPREGAWNRRNRHLPRKDLSKKGLPRRRVDVLPNVSQARSMEASRRSNAVPLQRTSPTKAPLRRQPYSHEEKHQGLRHE